LSFADTTPADVERGRDQLIFALVALFRAGTSVTPVVVEDGADVGGGSKFSERGSDRSDAKRIRVHNPISLVGRLMALCAPTE
jgi:hypothetical protein